MMEPTNIFIILMGGGLTALVLYFKSKATNAETTAIEATTKAEDAPLEQQQAQTQAKLDQVNKDLDALYEERKKMRNMYLTETDKDRAESWNTPKPPSQ